MKKLCITDNSVFKNKGENISGENRIKEIERKETKWLVITARLVNKKKVVIFFSYDLI